ncbi:MAG: glycerophosphodiester phosphodiesterase family protein [Pseudomonadota bacterium]
MIYRLHLFRLCQLALLLFASHYAFSDGTDVAQQSTKTIGDHACAESSLCAIGVQVGVRPHYLIDVMAPGELKETLQSCEHGPFRKTDFSIAHRGAPLQFPEHTRESYMAAARLGAGIIECDVTFTKDKELVCRHSQCDLHTTTDILLTPLAKTCRGPFQAAQFDTKGNLVTPASVECCTSDITLAEFKTLKGRMDNHDPRATTPEQYLGFQDIGQNNLYAEPGTLMTHRESIDLFTALQVKMTPELKPPQVPMPFEGFTQENYARKLIAEYEAAEINPEDVYAQSFYLDDILYWIKETPAFGNQAILLEGRDSLSDFDSRNIDEHSPSLKAISDMGVNIIAPPMWMLLEVEDGAIVPSAYARAAQSAGLNIIPWSIERSGPLASGGGYYYQSLNGQNPNPVAPHDGVIASDGDLMRVLHALTTQVGISGIFSDWPGTVTYYANCMGL